ncbi:hypothetical protein LINGRAPRIM_LOCUS462 [Linum grandiflorum]
MVTFSFGFLIQWFCAFRSSHYVVFPYLLITMYSLVVSYVDWADKFSVFNCLWFVSSVHGIALLIALLVALCLRICFTRLFCSLYLSRGLTLYPNV